MNIISSKFFKYALFFAIASLTVLVSAKQPGNAWEVVILVGTMLLQGFIAIRALASDPNATDADKSDNMAAANGKPKEMVIKQPADQPIPVKETEPSIINLKPI